MFNFLKNLKSTATESEKPLYGYQIEDGKFAEGEAMTKASRLVHDASEKGSLVRKWAMTTEIDSRAFLAHFQAKRNGKGRSSVSNDALVGEMAHWDHEISSTVRDYFAFISTVLANLEKLNPPLGAEQIGLGIEAILLDRRLTLSALDQLKDVIEAISRIKTTVGELEHVLKSA